MKERRSTVAKLCLKAKTDCEFTTLLGKLFQQDIYFGKLLSPIGRNVTHCSQLYSVNFLSLLSNQSDLRNFKGWLSSRVMSTAYRVSFLIELVMLRDGLLHVSNFDLDYVNCLIDSVCTD